MQVDMIDVHGDDLMVVNAARVSFDKESNWGISDDGTRNELLEKDDKLISYLARHNHWTPFGHPTITLRETVPIWVARERMRSNVGFVYNEVSRRYVDSPPEYYIPALYQRVENLKQGSSDKVVENAEELDKTLQKYFAATADMYEALLKDGVAPEQARCVLPVAHMTSYYVTGSLAAFARIRNLRAHESAAKEMQWMAMAWDAVIAPFFPDSWKALTADD